MPNHFFTKPLAPALLYTLIAAFYFLAGKLGLAFAFEQAQISPVWPPSGLAIAAVLHFGKACWPGIFLGALLVNLDAGAPLSAALAIASGNTLEALATGFLMRFIAFGFPFERVVSTVGFVAIVTLTTMISASLGVGTLIYHEIAPWSSLGLLWKTWWLGDLVGALVITPLLLSWAHPYRQPLTHLKRLEGGALLIATLALVSSFFVDRHSHHLLIFLLLPLLAWSALRFYHRGVTSIVTLFSAAAVLGTVSGYGPFVMETENASLLLLQVAIGAAMITALILTANQTERLTAYTRLEKSQADLEAQVKRRTQELNTTNLQLASEVAHQKQLTDTLEQLLDAGNHSSSQEFFETVVQTLAQVYGARYALVGTYAPHDELYISTLAVWAGDQPGDNFIYALEGTPCENVLDLKLELIPTDADLLYPEDLLLQQMGVKSYFGAPLRAPDGAVVGIIAVMDTHPMDVKPWIRPILGLFAERVAQELHHEAVLEEQTLAASVFAETIEAIVICDANSKIIRTNPAFSRITGYSEAEALGQSPAFLKSGMHGPTFYEAFWEALSRKGVWQGEIIDRRKNGEVFPAWQTITAVRDSKGEIKQFISIFSDITEQKISQERIYQLAHNDLVTGLPNRVSFHDKANTAMEHARRTGRPLAIMFIDLDHFKLINDTAGHHTGDLLLQEVARRLAQTLRKEDTLSRFGGDEFTVLIPEIRTLDSVTTVANNLLRQLAEPFSLQSMEVIVSASIGISIFPDNGGDVATLLKNADSAMYQAKALGRNNAQFFTAEMNRQAQERLDTEADLRRALKDNEFVLHYQPQIRLDSGQITGFEALVRWQHPKKGLIPPDKFIPVAETCGLIVPLGEWVLTTACQQLRQWQKQGHTGLTMAVNLSGRQFLQSDLLELIERTIRDSGIQAGDLELEITESMMMDNTIETIERLGQMRQLGIRLSIDDFGTGYSSLAYLKRFPIDKLKIDRSFISELPDNKDDAAIVEATIAVAHALNLEVVAEGVETADQLAFLKIHRCEQVQGYFFSRPLPAPQAYALLDQQQKPAVQPGLSATPSPH